MAIRWCDYCSCDIPPERATELTDGALRLVFCSIGCREAYQRIK